MIIIVCLYLSYYTYYYKIQSVISIKVIRNFVYNML